MIDRLTDKFKGTFTSKATAALAAGALTLGAFSTAAVASNDNCGNCHSNGGYQQEMPAFVQAGNYGLASPDNVGIVLYYGDGNGNSAEEIGEYVVSKVHEAARLKGIDVTPEYFIVDVRGEKRGASIGYYMGGTSIGPLGVGNGISDTTLAEVVDKRIATKNLLADNRFNL